MKLSEVIKMEIAGCDYTSPKKIRKCLIERIGIEVSISEIKAIQQTLQEEFEKENLKREAASSEITDAQLSFIRVKSKPIEFEDEMVKAIIEGRKKITRRISQFGKETKCKYGYSGDFLYVKENYFDARPFKNMPLFSKGPDFYYKADGSFIGEHKWNSNMPREAARIFLKITEVTFEKLLDISEEDAILEGVEHIPGLTSYWKHYSPTLSFSKEQLKDAGCPICKTAKASFFSFWRKLYGASSVELNDDVWVISFDIVQIRKGKSLLSKAIETYKK